MQAPRITVLAGYVKEKPGCDMHIGAAGPDLRRVASCQVRIVANRCTRLIGTAIDKRPYRAAFFVSIGVNDIREIDWQCFLGKEIPEGRTLGRSC